MNDRFKFRIALQTNTFVILVEPYYILEQGCFIDIDKAEKIFKNKYPDDCFWDFIDEIKKQDCIQEVSIDGNIIITKDFSNLIQCTGLKDKNGKLIYEGDIIVMPNQYPFYEEYQLNYVGIVEWIYSQWQYVYHCVNSSTRGISEGINNGLNDYGYDKNENTEYIILGNIYENKELLDERN